MNMEKETRRRFLSESGVTLVALTAGGLSPARRRELMPEGGSSAGLLVRDFGAKGDGQNIDSPAINRAIEAAASAGGGTVYFAAGTYLCYSIRLKSKVSLFLESGAT